MVRVQNTHEATVHQREGRYTRVRGVMTMSVEDTIVVAGEAGANELASREE